MSIFSEKLGKIAQENESRIVLALDLSLSSKEKDFKKKLLEKAQKVLNDVRDHVAGIKINFQLLLPLGLFDELRFLIQTTTSYGIPLIMDCKLNDVEHTNEWTARHIFDAGFGALIANPFVGFRGGLDSVFSVAEEYGGGVILLVYMSHSGADEGYGQRVIYENDFRWQYEVFAEKAKSWGAEGVVVGATQPKIIERVSQILDGKIPIFSPGIGFQGGLISEAFRAGTSYAIVGRTIYQSENPKKSAKEIKDKINEVIR
ncbi:MAG: orotidine 5'-phosphate decarboxylase / HUMPS family protein [Candidatus Jordarchaeum sp.]|uniref:orotidine 5'-phosphate decarboxylase / HUMPS family protein n=1 Tax=Candidatus Jordarchaeum sp. TaxID=2823881 RepID=UPI00404A802B